MRGRNRKNGKMTERERERGRVKSAADHSSSRSAPSRGTGNPHTHTASHAYNTHLIRRKFFSNWLPPNPNQASALAGSPSEGAPPPEPPVDAERVARESFPCAEDAIWAAVVSGVEGVVVFESNVLLLVLEGGSARTAGFRR